jgi:mRNA interferase RelE/StbE
VKSIILTRSAAKELDVLPQIAREAVQDALIRYALDGTGDIVTLSGRDGFRLRVGQYRVIFDEDARTILAIHIGRRTTTTYRRN